ncbi:uncharacterized protein LOC106070650 [Biomphalaria glabrata]|uniref:Uncharacterized protein LOC106070650 n=1 Tax=Biomphalaria glabrata TaxID=6526 RepID=A0A9U8EG91_BIOGL|nr:uncharacterized protein LOC106070650 [Biomphalaria glabrata]
MTPQPSVVMVDSGGEGKMKESGGHPLPTNIRELLWEDKSRTLRELITSYRPPLAVKLKGGDLAKYCPVETNRETIAATLTNNISSISSIPPSLVTFTVGQDALPSPVSSSGPTDGPSATAVHGSADSCVKKPGKEETILQIHETKRKKIILARKMTWEKRQNDYIVSGEQVEIPVSLKGWLEVLPDDGRPVEYFDTIGGITSNKCKRFLLRTSAVCHLLIPEENGNSCWIPFEVKPGEVLTTGIVYTDSKKTKGAAQKNIFKRLLKQTKGKKDQELKYLQCFDTLAREIMVPFIVNGVFSPVGNSSVANYDAVYELQDLILAFGFPVNVQVVHNGNNKDGPQWPKGVLRLYGAREEEFAVVSKVKPDGGLSLTSDAASSDRFEIPVDKDLLFSRGVFKKKPTIKPKLGDLLTNVSEKKTFQPEVKEKDIMYSRASSEEKQTYSMNNQRKPILAKSLSVTSSTSIHISSSIATTLSESESTTSGKEIITGIATLETKNTEENVTEANVVNSVDVSKVADSGEATSKEIELPERIPKELKKSRSTGILDKLSVRKVKKERAKLKELKGDDVFSKRIARHELSYQEFFNGLDDEGMPAKRSEEVKVKQDDSGFGSSNGTYKSITSNGSNKSGTEPKLDSTAPIPQVGRKINMKERDLPPIPPDSPQHTQLLLPVTDVNGSKESLYEHLPPAPHPPHFHRSKSSDSPLLRKRFEEEEDDDDDDDDDGYMIPVKTSEQRYIKKSEFQLRTRPSTPHESYRNEREKRSKSEVFQDFKQMPRDADDIDRSIDGLFDFAYEEFGDGRPFGAVGGLSAAVSTSHLYGAAQASKRKSDYPTTMSSLQQKFMDNLDLETRNHRRRMNLKHDQARQVNSNPNATIRSHNLKKLRPAVRDVFKSASSIHATGAYDLHPVARDALINTFQTSYDQQVDIYSRASRPVLYGSRSSATPYPHHVPHPPPFQNIYGPGFGSQYAESEPCYRHIMRPASAGGPAEMFVKHGDDSAISIGSKGDGGYPNESEYSFNEYMSREDNDGWTPPMEIEGMSVQEVSKSLRYIGMKDRVVLRFSNEQIDGSMLCTLDEKLLKEGFPELNALEVKKIVDFIRGWRPKKY